MAPARMMAQAREFRDIIRKAMDVPRVVGAGIGARPRPGLTEDSCEPVLTIMVDKRAPGDDIRIAGAVKGDRRQVEVVEVGRLSALGCSQRKV
jgi:hypothetical protein